MNLVNQIYVGANGRQSLIDFQEPEMEYNQIIFFIHGYKGYKDWGAWNLMQDYFIKTGIAFCKLNLSHNGGTIDNPIDFPDLEAFSLNRYSYEVEDVKYGLNWLAEQIDLTDKKVHIVGHSRGGGIAVLSGNNPRVSSVITMGSISDISTRFPKDENLEKWKEDGVYYAKNARTQQDMPHLFVFYEDWVNNKEMLDIEKHAKNLPCPILHIHGDDDSSVSILESEALSSWTGGDLFVINGANHTFNSYHPYDKDELPNKLNEACNLIQLFVNRQ